MAQSPLVAVVVLNWNGLDDSIRCLSSISELAYPNVLAVLVDNGSTDGSAEELRPLFPNCTHIRNSNNLGYAEGNNVGIRHALSAGADYVLLLNNDTIIRRDAVDRLVEVAEADRGIGILGPRVCFWDRPTLVWSEGGRMDPRQIEPAHLGEREEESSRAEEPVVVDYMPGCALMARADLLRGVGLLDPDYFLVFEETDLCARARASGCRIVAVPRAKVWHKVSSSFGGPASTLYLYYYHRNNLIYVTKQMRGIDRWRGYFVVLKRQAHYIWHLYRNKIPDASLQRRVIARAIFDFATRRWGEAR
jgi:GT2 family glycosyltransferase